MNDTIRATIGVWIFLILFTPSMLMIVMRASKIRAAISISMVMPISSSRAQIYALNPTSATTVFSIEAPQSPAPAIVPTSGPKVLSMYTYEPPDDGIAVDSSPLETAAGSMASAASMYASHIPDTGTVPPPISTITNAGRTKSPVPSMADSEIITTENIPSFLSRVSERPSVRL